MKVINSNPLFLKPMSIFHHQLKQSIIWRGFYFITLLLVNVFLSRFLKADGTGIIFYLVNFFSFLVLILSFNMDGSFTYFSAGKIIHHNKLAFVAIFWTLIVGIATYLFLPSYFNHFDKSLSSNNTNLAKYGLYYIAGFLLANYFTALFYSLGNFFLPNIILGFSNILFIGLIYFGIKTNAPSSAIVSDYFYFILLQGLFLAVAFLLKERNVKMFTFPKKIQFKQLINYSAIVFNN